MFLSQQETTLTETTQRPEMGSKPDQKQTGSEFPPDQRIATPDQPQPTPDLKSAAQEMMAVQPDQGITPLQPGLAGTTDGLELVPTNRIPGQPC